MRAREPYNQTVISLPHFKGTPKVAFAFASILLCTVFGAAHAQVLKFAAMPEEAPAVAQARFTPLLRYLETRGMSGVFIATPDMPAFIDAVVSKRVDFVWINAFTFVQARARMRGDLTCVAHRREDANFTSSFITRDPNITSLSGLADKSLMFGPRTSTTGHLMPRHFLKTEAPGTLEKLRTIRHGASHEAVIDHVRRSAADVGVINTAVLARLKEDGKLADDALRVIHTTPPFQEYCFALPGDRDPALFTTVQNALTGLDPRRPDHRDILRSVRASRIVAGSDDAYAPLEEIARELGLVK